MAGVRKKRRKKRIKYVGRRYSIRALLFSLMLVLATFFFFQSPFFDVSAIAVTGNATLSKPEARNLSGISKGTNIFRVDTSDVEDKLLLNPFVASVDVSRDLPQTISLSIVEHEPIAVVPVTEGFIEVSKEGYCLKQCKEISSLDLPIVSGLGIKKAISPGLKVENKSLPLALKILELSNKKGTIAEVDVHNISGINIFTFSKVRILLGNNEQLEDKINLAMDIAAKVPNSKYIDVRFPKSPVYK